MTVMQISPTGLKTAAVSFWGSRTRWQWLSLGLLVTMLVALLAVMLATGAGADEDAKDFSFYKLASNASLYFGEISSPEAEEGSFGKAWSDLTGDTGSGGAMLGYADPQFSVSNVIGWFFADVSGSSQTIRYDAFTSGENADRLFGLLSYSYFGAALADIGLDKMSSNWFATAGNFLFTGIMWLLWGFSLVTGWIFGAVLWFLQALNPFRWFYQGVRNSFDFGNENVALGMTGGYGDSGALFQGVAQQISSWYSLLQVMAWQVMVPLMLGILLLGLAFFRRMDRGSKVKRFVIRVLFIAFGLPLLGSMYTAALDNMSDDVGNGLSSNRIIASTYVDFEGWMVQRRLALPSGATVAWADGAATADSHTGAQATALSINRMVHPDTLGKQISALGTSNDEFDVWNKRAGMQEISASEGSSISTINDMLMRKLTSASIEASDLESGFKRSISDSPVDDTTKSNWFISDEFKDSKGMTKAEPWDNPVMAMRDGMQTDTETVDGSTVYRFKSNPKTVTGPACGYKVSDAEGQPASCNLSPLAAYNYLNTNFDRESMTLYSSNKAGSEMLRKSHMSVNLVGTGLVGMMNWVSAAVMLGCTVVLALTYAFGMLAGAIRRGFNMVLAVPAATLGSMAGILKVCVYGLMLAVEVLLTIFAYQLVVQLLLSVPPAFSGAMSRLFSLGGGLARNAVEFGLLSAMATAVTVIVSLLSTIVLIVLTLMLLRVRRQVIGWADEVITNVLSRFTEAEMRTAGPGMVGQTAKGLARGAAMGAGHAMAGKASRKLRETISSSTGVKGTNTGGLKDDQGGGGFDGGSGGPGGGLPGGDGPDGGRQMGGRDGQKVLVGADGRPVEENGESGEGSGSAKELNGRKSRLALPPGKAADQLAEQVRAEGGLSDQGYGSRAEREQAARLRQEKQQAQEQGKLGQTDGQSPEKEHKPGIGGKATGAAAAAADREKAQVGRSEVEGAETGQGGTDRKLATATSTGGHGGQSLAEQSAERRSGEQTGAFQAGQTQAETSAESETAQGGVQGGAGHGSTDYANDDRMVGDGRFTDAQGRQVTETETEESTQTVAQADTQQATSQVQGGAGQGSTDYANDDRMVGDGRFDSGAEAGQSQDAQQGETAPAAAQGSSQTGTFSAAGSVQQGVAASSSDRFSAAETADQQAPASAQARASQVVPSQGATTTGAEGESVQSDRAPAATAAHGQGGTSAPLADRMSSVDSANSTAEGAKGAPAMAAVAVPARGSTAQGATADKAVGSTPGSSPATPKAAATKDAVSAQGTKSSVSAAGPQGSTPAAGTQAAVPGSGAKGSSSPQTAGVGGKRGATSVVTPASTSVKGASKGSAPTSAQTSMSAAKGAGSAAGATAAPVAKAPAKGGLKGSSAPKTGGAPAGRTVTPTVPTPQRKSSGGTAESSVARSAPAPRSGHKTLGGAPAGSPQAPAKQAPAKQAVAVPADVSKVKKVKQIQKVQTQTVRSADAPVASQPEPRSAKPSRKIPKPARQKLVNGVEGGSDRIRPRRVEQMPKPSLKKKHGRLD